MSAAPAPLHSLLDELKGRVQRGSAQRVQPRAGARWCRAELSGRLSELSGKATGASLTLAVSLVLDAQREGEACAWISAGAESFYPPDVVDSGVDLEALPMIRAPGAQGAARAAYHLLRSGGFGLVVLDLAAESGPARRRADGSGPNQLPMGVLSRLARLAQQHACAVVCLTAKSEQDASLGSLVSLRVQARRQREAPGLYRCELAVLKDKRRGPGWSAGELCRGPAGLC